MFESNHNQTSIIWLQTLKKEEVRGEIGEPVANKQMKGTENGKEIGSKRDHTLNIKKKNSSLQTQS